MKKFLSLVLLFASMAMGQKADNKPELPVYEGLRPLSIQMELAPSFLFTEDPSDLGGLTFFDGQYVSVPQDIAERWIAAAFKKVDQTYVAELHDCDDKAFEMLVFLRREAMHSHPKLEYAILAGMAGVIITEPIPELGIDFTGNHAMVLIRVKGGTWFLIEPSTGRGTKLVEELVQGRMQLMGVWF